ncbi:MAG TPA: MEDS domain-containing protein, partial [Candidatus Baltobacteraceae bacterium]|nr:MEDS domain-containing protein [Candidatus Baltobacteraceae bacterium]
MNVHDLTAGQHAIAVYESPAEQAHLLAAFVREGLERRERVLYFSYRDSPADVAASLNRRGVHADRAVADGSLVLATADTTYLRGGAFDAKATKAAWFDAIAHTVASGFDVMRVAA